MARDLSQKQFDDACKRRGFENEGFMGYYKLPQGCCSVSVWNVGKRRRDQLAYLIKENERMSKKANRTFRSKGATA